jgi:rubrerythrin
MNLEQAVQLAFTRRLCRTPEGRAHVLAQVADAESSSEGQIFERALGRVDDPELRKLIEKHRADEIRHEALFRERLSRTGIDAKTPAELRIIDRLDSAVGGVLDRPIDSGRRVMEAYLLLQVLEERAVSSYPIMRRALQPHDPGSATTFEVVLADEERHLKYCRAIARRYAPSDEERQNTLTRFRAAEARAFRDNQLANARHVFARGLMGGALASLPWRAAVALSKLRAPRLTRFARERMELAQA